MPGYVSRWRGFKIRGAFSDRYGELSDTRHQRGEGDERTGDVTCNSFNVQFPVNIQGAGEATWNALD